jgi:hypothetical protein
VSGGAHAHAESQSCYTEKTMSRRLLYILCAVITFQLSWNVITSYCMHETGRAANHLGHHEHNTSYDELSLVAKDGAHLVKKVTVHDAHCGGYAHMSLATPDHVDTLPVLVRAEHVVSSVITAPGTVFLSPPERPQWTGRA